MLVIAWFIIAFLIGGIAFLIGGFIALWGYRRKAIIINDDTTYGAEEGSQRIGER